MEFIYLKKHQVLAMHNYLIKQFGGISGLRDEGLLESALAQAKQSAFGEDLYPGVFDKAAVYAFCLSENQSFLDGNKRIAVSVMATFLMVNGFELTCPQQTLYDTIMAMIDKKISKQEFSNFLKKNCRPV